MCSLLPTFFILYSWELNFGQIMWDKTKVRLGMFWGTSWEHVGNMLRTRKEGKKFLPPSFPKRKKLDPFLIGEFNLFFSYKSDDFGGYFPHKSPLYNSTTLLLVTKWQNFVTKNKTLAGTCTEDAFWKKCYTPNLPYLEGKKCWNRHI